MRRAAQRNVNVAQRSLDLNGRRVTLDALLGRGSAARVYRATLEAAFDVRRRVACKVFDFVTSEDHEAVAEALARTVRRTAHIRHPNVAAVYELGVAGAQAQLFILSELVEGVTLRLLIERLATRQRRLPLDAALFVGTEVAEALSGARRAKGVDGRELKIAHQGLSARDVLLSWHGDVKVSDFELAYAGQAASGVRNVRSLASRLETMAPEVACGAEGDARSDVFSMGVILRELLVGPRFGVGISEADALRFACEGYVQPITFAPHMPEGLGQIVNRALEVDPERRFPHAGAMAYELRRIAFGLGVGDARVFLRSLLASELPEEQSDATSPEIVPFGDRRR